MASKDKPTSAQNRGELFDVVDENDNVLRQMTRWQVHAGGYRHRAVHVLVFGSNRRIFLQKRSLAKDSSPGLWDAACSGHLGAGEDYDQAAHRELEEEIGLRLPAPPARWFFVAACAETGNEFIWVYRCTSEGPFVLNPAEIERGQWQTVDELEQAIRRAPGEFTRPFCHIWRQAAARLEAGR